MIVERKVEANRIWIFSAFAFGIAWTIDLVVYLTGGLTDVRMGSLSWALLVTSMAAPTLAHLLTRLVTREGWHNLYLHPRLKRGWRFWILAWLGTPLLVFLGAGLFYALFPQYLDSNLSAVRQLLDQARAAGRAVPVGPATYLVIQIVQAIIIGPLIVGPATFGEEFGWRAYLLPKLMPLGGRKAVIVLGVVWGVWHWPIIAMGHNYGLDYAGAPWLGLLGMVWFTLVAGTFLAWLTLNAGSVWPAVIGHAAINSYAALGAFLSRGQPNPLLGPLATGVIGSLPFAVLALMLLVGSHTLAGRQKLGQEPAQPSELAHRGV
jgi:membrane protease YdiL (CAAX protease family)